MKKIKKRKKEKHIFSWIFMIVLIIIVFCLSALIFNTDYLSPKIDELTTSYISFNNVESTDIIKISNIKRMDDDTGKSYRNRNSVSFNVNGKKNTNYEIVLYPIGTIISDDSVNFYLKNNVDNVSNSLNNMEKKEDGGIVIYKSTIGNEGKFTLKLWVDDDYNKSFKNLSYEVKIK